MYTFIDVEPGAISTRLFDKKFLKDERLFHSKIIAGEADGTLIYIDANGKFHVVHGTGPAAAEMEKKVEKAVSMIADGVQALATLGMSLK